MRLTVTPLAKEAVSIKIFASVMARSTTSRLLTMATESLAISSVSAAFWASAATLPSVGRLLTSMMEEETVTFLSSTA